MLRSMQLILGNCNWNGIVLEGYAQILLRIESETEKNNKIITGFESDAYTYNLHDGQIFLPPEVFLNTGPHCC